MSIELCNLKFTRSGVESPELNLRGSRIYTLATVVSDDKTTTRGQLVAIMNNKGNVLSTVRFIRQADFIQLVERNYVEGYTVSSVDGLKMCLNEPYRRTMLDKAAAGAQLTDFEFWLSQSYSEGIFFTEKELTCATSAPLCMRSAFALDINGPRVMVSLAAFVPVGSPPRIAGALRMRSASCLRIFDNLFLITVSVDEFATLVHDLGHVTVGWLGFDNFIATADMRKPTDAEKAKAFAVFGEAYMSVKQLTLVKTVLMDVVKKQNIAWEESQSLVITTPSKVQQQKEKEEGNGIHVEGYANFASARNGANDAASC